MLAPGGSSDLGNTTPGRRHRKGSSARSEAPRCNAAKRWCWTWNNPPADMAPTAPGILLEKISGTLYGYGLERAPTTGTVHLQGWVAFRDKCRPIEKTGWTGVHWEVMKGSVEQSIDYCSKEGEYYTNRKPDWKPDDVVADYPKMPWQEAVLARLDAPQRNERRVHVYGGQKCGKTRLAKHLVLRDPSNTTVFTSLNRAEILDGLRGAKPGERRTFIWDVPDGDQNKWPGDLIHALKGGLVVARGKTLMWDRTDVLVFVPGDRLADVPEHRDVSVRNLDINR